MAANEERGEFELKLGPATYGLRPSWEAIQAFELGTGKSLMQLAGEADRGALALSSAAIIVTECMRAWGRALGNTSARGAQVENVTPMLMEAGIYLVQPRLALMLYMAATGGLTSSGEAKAAPAKEEASTENASKASPAPRSGGGRGNSGRRRQ
nr:hypothetical protein [Sphingomonas sp.]